MVQFITAIARTASIPPWMRSEPWAGILIILLYDFVDCDHVLELYLNHVGNATFELYFTSAAIYQTWFVITLFRILMDEMYL